MKRLIFMAVTSVVFIFYSKAYALEDFIRGTWLTYTAVTEENFHCVPGQSGWHGLATEDSVNWELELMLLRNMNVNLNFAWIKFEDRWMEEVCLGSGGDIKMYVGGRSYPPLLDSLLIGFWVDPYASPYPRWKDYSYNHDDWTAGVDRAIAYWDTAYSDKSGLFGYYLAHEILDRHHSQSDKNIMYGALGYMATSVNNIDPDKYSGMVDDRSRYVSGGNEYYRLPFDPEFVDSAQHLDIFEFDRYPYEWEHVWFGDSIAISGERFQKVIDSLLIGLYDSLYILWDGHANWVAVTQAMAHYWPLKIGGRKVSPCECIPEVDTISTNPLELDTIGGQWVVFPDSLNISASTRLPSREEIRLQAFLAISRDAKGIIIFGYGSNMQPTGFSEVLMSVIDYNGDERHPWIPFDDDFYGEYAFNYYDDGKGPYHHMQELYSELEAIGPTLIDLRTTAIASYGVDDELRWVDEVESDWVKKLTDPVYGDTAIHYWELTTFIDTSTIDSTDYFMFVNRVTCDDSVDNEPDNWEPAEARPIAAIFTQPSGYYPIVQNIYTGDATYILSYDSIAAGKYWFTFPDTVDPGDGEIYRVTNAYVFGGPITDSTTISHDIILTGDLVIDTGGTLVVNPGVTVHIYPDYDDNNQGQSDSTIEIITKGRLYANGISTDSVRFIPFATSPEKGDWVGIYLDVGAYAEFSHCNIQYGDRGIEIRNNAEAIVSNSNVNNHSSMGIYNFKGYLDLINSTINNSGAYGLYGHFAADSVYNTTFVDNEVYGIKVYGIHINGDSSYFLYDTISTSYSPSQSGILVEGNDKVRIEGCKIRSYDYAAIKLNNSDVSITDCDLTSNTNYGIYCVSSSPKVRDCLLDTLSIGVYNFMLGTGIADLGKNIEGEYGNNSILDCRSWLIYFAGIQFGSDVDTLFAQMNWWGDPDGPDTEKFYVNDPVYKKISYIPYLGEDPLAKLASQLPLQFSLNQNYPNPFNSNTTISFSLDKPGKTVIKIYNILGQQVKTPVNEMLDAGSHGVIWDGRNSSGSQVASGVYFYTIQSGDNFASKKMLLLR